MDAYLYTLTDSREAARREARLREYTITLASHEADAYGYAVAYATALRDSAPVPLASAFRLSRSEALAIAVRVANIMLAS